MNRTRYGLNSEPMSKKGNSKIEALTALPGIGAATAKKLISAKIDSVSKVASAGSKKLQDAGLSAAVAKKVSAAAKAADKAAGVAKKTSKKAKSAAKSTASKSKKAATTVASKRNRKQRKQHPKPKMWRKRSSKRRPQQPPVKRPLNHQSPMTEGKGPRYGFLEA